MSNETEIALPDENLGSNLDGKKANKRSRKARIIIVSGISVLIIIIIGMLLFGGSGQSSLPDENINSALKEEAPGQFIDSRLQDALKKKIEAENLEKLRNQVKQGEAVAHFKDEPTPVVAPEPRSVERQRPEEPSPEDAKNMFAEIDRFALEQKEKNEQMAKEQRINNQENLERRFSSRTNVPSESGKGKPPVKPGDRITNRPANTNVNPSNANTTITNGNGVGNNTLSKNTNTEQEQRDIQRNIGLANAAQLMRNQSSNAAPPEAVYYSNSQPIKLNVKQDASDAPWSPANRSDAPWSPANSKKESRVLTMHHTGDLGIAWLEGLVDSDVPSAMVVAQIMEGPLRGGRLLGRHAIEGECILIDFNLLQWNGREVGVKAAAADEKTGQTCLSGKVNYRMLKRYGAPILFSIARVGQEYHAQKDVTTTSIDGLGTSTANGGRSFESVAKGAGIDGTMDAIQDPVNRLANTPIQVKKEQGIIGIRWLDRLEIDMSVKR